MKYLALMAAVATSFATAGFAVPVNGTGDVTPDVIFGSGNANGSFSTDAGNEIAEIALRAKLRYDLSGVPQNVFNYDGDRTYTFDPAFSNAPSDRSAFNFEWSINTDPTGTTGYMLNQLTYLLEIDYDATIGTSFVSFDPINVPLADHAIGTNATGNGGGSVAGDASDYANLIANNNVAQNSWNLGFFSPLSFDPQSEGLYTINLSSFLNDELVAKASIDILYGDMPAIPVPASLPLLAAGMLGLGLVARRRGKPSA